VLTKEEWLDIISFFSVKGKDNATANAAGLQVDYMFFIESVLDPQGLQDSMLELWKDKKDAPNDTKKDMSSSLSTQGQMSRKNNENIIRGKLYDDPSASSGARKAGSTSRTDQAQFTPEQSRLLDKFRRELEEICEKQTRNSKTFKTIKDYLVSRLMDEDKNGSGALTKQSLFACLNSIGINPQIYFGNNSKEIFEQIMDKTGKILIKDFLTLCFK
jgi:hypothetical protein